MKDANSPEGSDSASDGGRSHESVIFLHVPKTAGTTLNRLIEWEYRISEMYSIDPVLYEWSGAHLRKLPRARLRETRMFKGHMVFGLHEVLPQKATYITVLRDPVDRVISSFYFMRSHKLHPLYWKFRREKWSLDDFVRRSPRDNVQCKILAGTEYAQPCTEEICERAITNLLRHFSVVGLSERFEESLALLKLRFGWKLGRYASFNVTRTRPRKTEIPQSTLDLIRETNSFDMALYQTATDTFQTAIATQADEVSRIAGELKAMRAQTQSPLEWALLSIRAAGRKAVSRAYSAI